MRGKDPLMNRLGAQLALSFVLLIGGITWTGCIIDEAGDAVESVGDEIEDATEEIDDTVDPDFQ
jgi:hypothetical protein